MHERSGDPTNDQSSVALRITCGVGNLEQRLPRPLADYGSVMKFMSSEFCLCGTQRGGCQGFRTAIPQVQLWYGEGRAEREQTNHLMRVSVSIGQRIAQNHIAAAFAVNSCTPRRGVTHTAYKFIIAR